MGGPDLLYKSYGKPESKSSRITHMGVNFDWAIVRTESGLGNNLLDVMPGSLCGDEAAGKKLAEAKLEDYAQKEARKLPELEGVYEDVMKDLKVKFIRRGQRYLFWREQPNQFHVHGEDGE